MDSEESTYSQLQKLRTVAYMSIMLCETLLATGHNTQLSTAAIKLLLTTAKGALNETI